MDRQRIHVAGQVRSRDIPVSERAAIVAGMFGVAVGGVRERALFAPVDVDVGPGDVVLVTGASGAGKSSFLRELASGLRGRGAAVMDLAAVAVPDDRAAVDCFDCPLEEALGHLGRAGLSEAHLLVAAPGDYSEGQKFRFRIARLFASAADVLVADEFGATLDRVTAKVVAWQVGKFARAAGKTVLLATTHEDLEEDLQPTIKVWKGLGEELTVTYL